MYFRVAPSLMRFQVLSSLVCLTTLPLFLHEVQGIRCKEMVSSISIRAHETTLHEEKVIVEPQTSAGSENYEGATMEEEEMMVVVRRRRRTMSSTKVTSTGKKKQQQPHHHWMPSIHEDYYGPRHHKPAHH